MHYLSLRTQLVALLLSSVLATAGCSGGGDAPWENAFDTSSSGFLSSVWGSGPDDVFIVGGQANAEIYHYDGSDWSPMAAPIGAGLLVWVFGFGPNDVYSVGLDGTFIHYDGSEWTSLDSGTDQDLWGIWGRSPNDMWIVGGNVNEDAPLLLHYTGTAPPEDIGVEDEENPLDARALFKVWGIGSKTFAVGQKGLILEYDGTNWTRVGVGENGDSDFVSLWGTSETDIVVVGGRGTSRIATYNGTSFDTVKPSGVTGTSAVFMDRPGHAIVGGEGGFLGSYQAGDTEITGDIEAFHDVHAVWGDGEGTIYAVGGFPSAPFPSVALVQRN